MYSIQVLYFKILTAYTYTVCVLARNLPEPSDPLGILARNLPESSKIHQCTFGNMPLSSKCTMHFCWSFIFSTYGLYFLPGSNFSHLKRWKYQFPTVLNFSQKVPLGSVHLIKSLSPPVLSETLSFSPPVLSETLSFSPPVLSETLSFSPPVLSETLSFSPPVLLRTNNYYKLLRDYLHGATTN